MLAILLVLLFTQVVVAQPPPAAGPEVLAATTMDDYRWDHLAIGGGGYVTGIVIHPDDPDLRYKRTDVGGAYRWDPEGDRWVQLLNWVGPSNENLIGVDGVALDPGNPERVYLALGKRVDAPGGVYRSEDRGETWTLLMPAFYEGNGRVGRWIGECIAVDPNNSSILYAGTRTDGLWRSTDDGQNWTRVSGVPNGHVGNNPTGVRSIAFDPAGIVGGASATLYVGVPGDGVYASTDGGETFAPISGPLAGTGPANPARMQVVDEQLFVTHGSGVAVWSGSEWRNITPPEGAGRSFSALAVDDLDTDRMVVAEHRLAFFNPVYRSTDGGQNWDRINDHTSQQVSVPWWGPNWFSSATAAMAFVPGQPGELLLTTWISTWRTPDVWASPVTEWHTVVSGHEETVNVALVAPPAGALVYSGMADVFGFRHDHLDQYPDDNLYPVNEGFDVAVSEHSPNDIAILGASSWGGDNTVLATSTDHGETWTTRTLPAGTTLGRVAISATHPDIMVYIAAGGAVYHSSNRGQSWAQSAGAPVNAVRLQNIWNKEFSLAADKVDGQTFYIYDRVGTFYASFDGGATWSSRNVTSLPNANWLNVDAAPGLEGEVWISLGNNGLWKSSDYGGSFTRVTALQRVDLFSFGASAPGSDVPAAYAYGRAGGQWGLYRSLDMGDSWVRINPDTFQFPAGAKTLAADRNVFGRVFVGSGGVGIAYGEIDGDAPTGDELLQDRFEAAAQ